MMFHKIILNFIILVCGCGCLYGADDLDLTSDPIMFQYHQGVECFHEAKGFQPVDYIYKRNVVSTSAICKKKTTFFSCRLLK